MPRNRKRVGFCLFLLIVIQAILLIVTAWQTGPGWDEWGHLPAGLFNLQYGDFHPYRVNPPLVRLIGAMPVVLLGGGIDFELLPKAPGFRSEGYLGMAYVHQQGPDVFHWVSVARTAAIPIALFGTFLLNKVGKHFGGSTVGISAAALWVFSPTILAYGGTITPDTAATVFGFWATWCFYCWYRIGRSRDAIWLGTSVAAALLSKATWIILPPIFLVMFVTLQVVSSSPRTLRQQFVHAAIAAIVSWVLVHAAYDFRGVLRPLGSFAFISEALSGNNNSSIGTAPKPGNRFAGTPIAWIPAPLPASYVAGIDVQKRDFELTDMRSYLMGTWGERGWWYYYAMAWLVKEPLAFWLMLAVGWFLALQHRGRINRTKRVGSIVMMVPGLVVFLFVSSQTGFNHHLRYVLPAFPAMFLLAALPVSKLKFRGHIVILTLLAWLAISSVAMVPRTYAYFSEAVGGWRNGHKYLNASNLDWGQDLLSIRQWARDNPDKRPIHLLYSPSQLDFRRLGIDATIAEGKVSSEGPTEDGWWVVSIDRVLNEPNDWFLRQTPTERISVSTTVYHIVDGQVVESGRSEVDERNR
jgi:4-amino-4-deoxy-L-arabinose transferase-like glycosyltransferase